MTDILLSSINPNDLIELIAARTAELITSQRESHTQDQPDQLLTVEQAAAFLHIQRSTIYSKVSKGKLPSMKQFGRLYFSRAELIAYAKAGKRKTIAETQLEAQKYINSKEGVYNA